MALRPRLAIAATASYFLIGGLVAASFAMSLISHLSEPYYHAIDDITYHDFLWVREYVPPSHPIGVLNTGEAWAFAAVSGKLAYTTEVAPNFHEKGRLAMEFLNNGARDTSWLRDKGISIVYIPVMVNNNQLIKVSRNLYLLPE